MATPGTLDENNKSARLFFKICQLAFLVGFPNFWMEDLKFSKKFTTIYGYFSKLINVTIYLFLVSEWAGMFTQTNLTEKQRSDMILFCLSHPVLSSYRLILTYHGQKVKELIHALCVELKQKVNDEDTEKRMIRKAIVYSSLFIGLCTISLILYGMDGLRQTIRSDGTFTTVIPAWPSVDDKRTRADVARILIYMLWWVFMSRVFGAYTILISLIVALEHQYKNLGKYFRNLTGIFEKDLSQAQKEKQYEDSVRVGIKLHASTLRCTRLAQDSFSSIYGGHIMINTSVIVLLMLQMVSSERNLSNVFVTVEAGSAMLLSTGFLMLSGGDITVEAENLPTEMYGSGWHYCRATRTRKMLALAMMQGQKPVFIQGFGVLTISYSTYLSIVKSAYSVFSVLY